MFFTLERKFFIENLWERLSLLLKNKSISNYSYEEKFLDINLNHFLTRAFHSINNFAFHQINFPMKLKLLTLFSFIILASCNNTDKKDDGKTTDTGIKIKLVIKGSDSVLPLGQKEAEVFSKNNPGSTISISGGGTGVGIAALLDGTTDIAMASRSLKTDEKIKLESKDIKVVETQISWDALSIIINPKNKVSQLTKEQLKDIFTGKVTNWNQVGGDNLKIVVYTRETSSGTYEFIKDHVLDKINFVSSALSLPATGAIVQSVSQTPGAIGYVGIAYVNKEVKDIAVSYDKGKSYVSASVATAKNKTYPISRPLFFYYSESKATDVKPFLDFILSAEGQKIVEDVGYVSLN